ncbi:S9 family peptidase [Amycolatopsis sp. 195334CR]|uniref:alpha/beta hydrolase family protein n=1 Tax=Amycolatopsis sp. 195334CR TaxID=2814588 RepID=UPI001A8DF84E|nr:prolyl oligopeptidase family serine peptidase [Amycolatopsis sp. 195334CR]MBN6037874.1 prolyl oligopeptidase family serine peptidase [Amycolatopsis sp. 195334CR]
MLRTKRTAILLAVAGILLSLFSIPAQAKQEPQNADFSFPSGAKTLHGSIVGPPPDGIRRPGVVLVHGSGRVTREKVRREAEAFAAQGVVTLIYDKDLSAYSTVSRDFSALADDAVAALAYLRTRPEVDPARTGLWGLSEGAWVAPLAATRSDPAFLILVGGNGVSPVRAQSWSYRRWLGHQGVTAPSVLDRVAVNGTRIAAEAGLFPEADYDPVPSLRALRLPVLGIWGGKDNQSPPGDATAIYAGALAANPSYTMRVFPEAHHSLIRTTTGFDRLDALEPGYPELVGSWVHGLAAGAPPSTSDAPPAQAVPAAPLTPLAWWESLWVQGFALLALVVAFAAYPLTARRRREGLAAARWTSAAGLLAVTGFLAFLGTFTMSNGQEVGPVVLDRPLLWLVTQLVAVGALVAAGFTAAAWRRSGASRIRLGLLLGGAVLLIPWGLYWGLLLP